MKTEEIIKEIKKLPIRMRKIVIKEAIGSIREDEPKDGLSTAADSLAAEYRTNQELTAFNDIDQDDFYETGRDMDNQS
ncbi:MAG: hypothetical protein ABFS10_00975 [Bacteroidota bacterium]